MPGPTHSSVPVSIEDEMRRSYMDYAMSVIIGRALPDVRDGLKPAHRRVIFGMRGMGLAANRPYRKCAKIVGEVMGNFHPHGDASIYDTLVRLAQGFNMRYPLVDGRAEREVKLRIMEVLFSEVIPTPRDVVIICLADACGIFTELLSKREVRHALPRIELIRKMDLIGRAVTAAIWDIEVSLAKAIRPHMA